MSNGSISLILSANRQFSTGSDGFGAEDIELRAELPQVVKGIGPLENQQRQQYDSADIGY